MEMTNFQTEQQATFRMTHVQIYRECHHMVFAKTFSTSDPNWTHYKIVLLWPLKVIFLLGAQK